MQNITKGALLELRFPLPPLDVQHELVTQVAAMRAEIVRERAEAARLAKETGVEVAEMILGRKRVE